MGFPALTAHVFPSIICTATKGDDIAPFTEFFLACPQGHNIVCLFGFHKVKEAYLGNTETLLWTFTFAILNQVWQLQWKIFTSVYIYWGRGGTFGREEAFGVIPHPFQMLLKKLFITHKGKKKKMSRSRLYNVPIADPLKPPITREVRHIRELFTPICAEEFQQ